MNETAALNCFPKNVSDVRDVMFGAFGGESAGGGVSMRFYCTDHAGHTFVEAKVESDRDSADRVQSAVMIVPIEASAIDSFIDELRSLGAGATTTARLSATAGRQF